MQLQLNEEEEEFLTDLLEQVHRELWDEVHNTEDHYIRTGLERRKSIADALLNKMELEKYVDAT
jgi:hypothetical protein